jgi:hypothetical protein
MEKLRRKGWENMRFSPGKPELSSISNLEKELKSFGHGGSKTTLLKYAGYAKETRSK